MRGPTTPAGAWPEVTTKAPVATASASSKSLPRRGERQGGRAGAARADQPIQSHRAGRHDREVRHQPNRDAGHVAGPARDGVPQHGEEHDDGEQQAARSDGPIRGSPRHSSRSAQPLAQRPDQDPGQQRDAQEDQHRPGDVQHREAQRRLLDAQPPGQRPQVEPHQGAERDSLEHRVDRHQDRAGLAVAGQVLSGQHHDDAPGRPAVDQPVPVRPGPAARSRRGRRSRSHASWRRTLRSGLGSPGSDARRPAAAPGGAVQRRAGAAGRR